MPFDTQEFRHAMSQFATGVVVVSAQVNDELVGFAAQSFVSLSLVPPLVAVCPQKASTSWPRIRDVRRFSINVLSEAHSAISDAFAIPGNTPEVGWKLSCIGQPILEGSLMHIDCELAVEHEAGDHTIAVAEVLDLEVHSTDASPLLYFRAGYGSFRRG